MGNIFSRSSVEFRRRRMKSIIALVLILAFFAITIESCLVVVTCDVAQATCASPCFQCGVCKEKCCQNVFLGREEETLEDRTLQIECAPVTTAAPAGGRIFDDRQSEGIEFIEKKAFELCDEDGDTGLSWEEVEICEETYGPYVNLDPLPTKEDFDSFDLDQNGILFFEEWLSGQ